MSDALATTPLARRGPPDHTKWKPGQSGNPSGKRSLEAQFKRACQDNWRLGLDGLLAALGEPGERVAAAKVLFAYGFGAPERTVNVRVIKSVEDLSDEELRALAGLGDVIEGELADGEAEADPE